MTEKKNKRERPEDFIGWKSEDGRLEVIGIDRKCGRKGTFFRVTCTECSKDKELFPDGYFVSTKGRLKAGQKPCGCSKKPEWKYWQFLILARRAGEERFIVHDFAEKFHGNQTRLNLECLKDGHKWTASINATLSGNGCPKCSGVYKPTEQEALQKCIDICKEMNYDIVGFPDGYKNHRSRVEYICKTHGKQKVQYYSFTSGGRRCMGCWKDKRKELGNGNGYYPERKDEQDFLYVLDFNGKFIKVGRSFDVDDRIRSLRSLSKIKKIKKLRIFTATHQEIYDLEQELHSGLRDRGFKHNVDWSTECFEKGSLSILNELLDNCRLNEVHLN